MITPEEISRRENEAELRGWQRAIDEEMQKRYLPFTTKQVRALARFYETATGLLASSIAEDL